MMRYTHILRKSVRAMALLGILLFVLALSPTQQAASAPGKWDILGPAFPKVGHTLTRLLDGRILVVGGADDTYGHWSGSNVEIYDPATRTFSLGVPMAYSRNGHTATMLPDGRVLVVGGKIYDGNYQLTGTAEIYDPVANSWSPAASMSVERIFHTATLLNDGRVLIAGGGRYYNSNIHASAEIYDPAANTWNSVDSLSVARTEHTATLLNDGTVLVAGGHDGEGGIHSTAELFDLVTETWSVTGNMNVARTVHTATLLPDGKVLVAGGTDNTGDGFNTAEIYDPALGTWALTGAMSYSRFYHEAMLMVNGLVVVAGGYSDGAYIPNAEIYDPIAGTWRETNPLNRARGFFEIVALDDGVLVVGGFLGQGIFIDVAEIFDVTTEEWFIVGSLRYPVWEHATTLLNDGRVLITGGRVYSLEGDGEYLPIADIYDPVTNLTTAVGDMNESRGLHHTATLLNDGRVLAAGGYGLDSSEIFDPATNIWTAVGDLTDVRSGHTTTRLFDGRVLVTGGGPGEYGALASAEIFDPTSNTWSAATSMHTPRRFHTATLLPDGRVLVAGGSTDLTRASDGVEIYDPATGMWLDAGSMNIGRYNHTATLLNDGRVLVAGGGDYLGDLIGPTEVYDPTTDTWTTIGALNIPRVLHKAVLLTDGRVLVAGGDNDNFSGYGVDYLRAEVFYPTTGTWGISKELNYQRLSFGLIQVPDGRVLALGGMVFDRDALMTTTTIEVYNPIEPTLTSITSDSPDPSLPGDPVTVAFQVTSGGGTPTGTVTVSASSGESCAATVAEGSCTFTLGSVGEHTLTASYEGDEGHDGSTSVAEPHSVVDWTPTDLSAESVSTYQIDLSWTDRSSIETAYAIERSPNGTDSWAEIDTVAADVTSYEDIGLVCETAYYYRVRAYRDSDGSYSAYSNIADTTTQTCLPEAPTLISPADSASIDQMHPVLTWSALGWTPENYEVVIEPLGGGTPLVDQWVSAATVCTSDCTWMTNTTLSDGDYQWQVRGYTAGVGASEFSATWTFELNSKVELVAPSSGATVDFLKPTFTWNKPSWSPAQYNLIVEPFGGGTALINAWLTGGTVCGASECTWTPSSYLADGDYQWRVLAYTSGYGASSWADAHALSVAATPTPILPADGGTSDLSRPDLTWKELSWVAWYQVEITQDGEAPQSRWVNAGAC
ncbi:MAG: Ig-like domain repeat protein, partial [Anaerolineales bacterium]|nr:Ig-like domain repeat protein [Anaerolineales bacterium]